MAWVKFTRDRAFTHEDRRVTTQFLADREYSVKADWAEIFVEEGSAVRIPTPGRGEGPSTPIDQAAGGPSSAGAGEAESAGPGGVSSPGDQGADPQVGDGAP